MTAANFYLSFPARTASNYWPVGAKQFERTL